MTRKEKDLLRWAIRFIRTLTDEIAEAHFNPSSNKIEPGAVRVEVRNARRWIQKAEAALS